MEAGWNRFVTGSGALGAKIGQDTGAERCSGAVADLDDLQYRQRVGARGGHGFFSLTCAGDPRKIAKHTDSLMIHKVSRCYTCNYRSGSPVSCFLPIVAPHGSRDQLRAAWFPGHAARFFVSRGCRCHSAYRGMGATRSMLVSRPSSGGLVTLPTSCQGPRSPGNSNIRERNDRISDHPRGGQDALRGRATTLGNSGATIEPVSVRAILDSINQPPI
jgi:hypothetical protein